MKAKKLLFAIAHYVSKDSFNYYMNVATFCGTPDGKFVTKLDKLVAKNPPSLKDINFKIEVEEENLYQDSLYKQEAIHESFEKAIAWFKPGKLTDEIYRQLGVETSNRFN